jgi:hypothetical protein
MKSSPAFKLFSWEEANNAFGPFNQNEGVHIALEISQRFNRFASYESDSVFKIAVCIGDEVTMPKPNGKDDAWKVGGFSGRVTDVLDNGLVIVEDQDGDSFTVEAQRLEIESA